MLRPTILIALLSVTVGCSYRREEVTFRNGAVSLAGTLTLPSGNKPHPAVVFIHGSGPDSRENYSFYAELLRVTVEKRGRERVVILRGDNPRVPPVLVDRSQDFSIQGIVIRLVCRDL